ncbi:hypothetical protein INN77_24855 (plasmid) [Salmonella enterica]|nr:hypothetical protein INN77_24855 [Salmonella enterica]
MKLKSLSGCKVRIMGARALNCRLTSENPRLAIKGLNLTATESAFRCCSGILQPEKIKRLFMRISKKAMHQFRQTGME